jgi:hypothetical protein
MTNQGAVVRKKGGRSGTDTAAGGNGRVARLARRGTAIVALEPTRHRERVQLATIGVMVAVTGTATAMLARYARRRRNRIAAAARFTPVRVPADPRTPPAPRPGDGNGRPGTPAAEPAAVSTTHGTSTHGTTTHGTTTGKPTSPGSPWTGRPAR